MFYILGALLSEVNRWILHFPAFSACMRLPVSTLNAALCFKLRNVTNLHIPRIGTTIPTLEARARSLRHDVSA
jgi:hypothetical protein